MPVSDEQKSAILAMLREGMDRDEIAKKVGVSSYTVSAVKAHVTMGTYADLADVEEVADAMTTTFGLERDLQLALRSNIGQLEKELKIVDGGKEQTVDSGHIDITAQDHSGVVVVIELKAGTVDREAIGQILSYMGDVAQSKRSVRGILVAGDFSSRAVSAARAVPNLQLKKYSFQFTFESVGAPA